MEELEVLKTKLNNNEISESTYYAKRTEILNKLARKNEKTREVSITQDQINALFLEEQNS